MRITRTHQPFAAEVDVEGAGLDALTGGTELRGMLVEHKVLVFRDLDLAPEQHVALMARLGPVITEMPSAEVLADPRRLHGQVSFVTTEPGEYITGRYKLAYHSDFSFYRDGAGDALSLYAIQTDREDPTVFADMTAAAASLTNVLRARLRAVDVVKCANFFHQEEAELGQRYRLAHRDPGKDYGSTASVHPALIRHPRSGAELLNICQTFTSHVKGWTHAESDRLFAEAEHYQYLPQHLYRHHWRRGDLVIWDNIALQHGREPVQETVTRHLRRVVSNPYDVEELQRRTGLAVAPEDLGAPPEDVPVTSARGEA